MKNFILIVLTVIIYSVTSCGQQEQKAIKITNTLTEKHITTKGTKCSLIPPFDFIKSNSFSGFQQTETNSSIMIVEIPGPFEEISASMTKDGLLTKGMDLEYKESFIVNNRKSVLIHTKQSAYNTEFSKLIFLFGDEKSTIMINGVCPSELEQLKIDLRKSILTVIYDTNQVLNPLESVRFQVDVSNSKFKIGKFFAGSLLYTTDGKVPTESSDKSNIIVGATIGKIQIGNTKDLFIKRMKQLPKAYEIKNKNIKKVIIDEMNGYESIAYTKEGKKEMIYQLMLFNEDEYYLFLGSSEDNFKENIKAFKQIAKTFKRK